MAHSLQMRDECGARESVEFDDRPTADECREACEEWCQDGDWGSDGASVSVWWTLEDEDGDEIDDGSVTVEIEPDHDALIRRAGGDTDCDHDWTAEGEGGCRENPGVWSTGGTTLVFHTHCRLCGLHRRERSTGSQRNPGEHDTVEYTQPESWCTDCESEECECSSEVEA